MLADHASVPLPCLVRPPGHRRERPVGATLTAHDWQVALWSLGPAPAAL